MEMTDRILNLLERVPNLHYKVWQQERRGVEGSLYHAIYNDQRSFMHVWLSPGGVCRVEIRRVGNSYGKNAAVLYFSSLSEFREWAQPQVYSQSFEVLDPIVQVPRGYCVLTNHAKDVLGAIHPEEDRFRVSWENEKDSEKTLWEAKVRLVAWAEHYDWRYPWTL